MSYSPPISATHRAVLMSNPWFAGLPEETRGNLLEHARLRTLTSEQRLYSRGDDSDGLYAVLEGSVRLGGTSRDGRETILDFYGPGFWFGEVSVFDGMPRSFDADAHGPATLLQVALADMEALLAGDLALARAFLQLEAHRLRILLAAIESYSVQTLEQRLANRLLMLSERYGVVTEQGTRIDLHLPQEILAQLIGSTRQRVNQILKDWEVAQLVRQQYGRVLLLHPERLSRIARL